MSELEKLIGEPEKETPKEPLADPAKDSAPQKTEEEVKKEEHLQNLNKAIAESTENLRKIRTEAKTAKPADDELPKIDLEDPSAKAWDKRIQETVSPVQAELEMEKGEVRTAALRDFLTGRPALAKNPDKLKQLISEYEVLSKGKISEKTKEGVELYLEKAYASVFHEELLNTAREKRVNEARAESTFSDPAVDRGATSYRNPQDVSKKQLTQEERDILVRWGMSAEEWLETNKKYGDQ